MFDSLQPHGLLAHQSPLSLGFSRQGYWSGLPCPPPGHLPDPGIKPMLPALQAGSLLLSHLGSPSTIAPPPNGWTLDKIPKEMGTPDHLTCLLRNLYAGQEATVRTGHGTTDLFQTGKGVRQGCILSPCLFNLYAQYIMRNAGLKEAQAGI